MPRVKAIRPHAYNRGIGVYRVGEEYDEADYRARQKAERGFVQYVESKESPTMYRRMVVEDSVTLIGRNGNWYSFSDGDKLIGKSKAAEKLGVSVPELEELADNVDSDDD